MAIHNDSVNEIHIVLLILHWQVCFLFVYLQNASFNPHSSSLYSVYRIDSILNRKDRVVCCRFIPCEEPLALHWVTLMKKHRQSYKLALHII